MLKLMESKRPVIVPKGSVMESKRPIIANLQQNKQNIFI